MFIKTFQGYNCYSSAIGEAATGKKESQIKEVILSEWSYFFNKEHLYSGQWYTGAAEGPVDIWLRDDLYKYLGVEIRHYTSDKKNAIRISNEILKRQGRQIVLLDFYYLNSFNWKSLKRFNVERQHDPHFVILEELYEDKVKIIDPFYHHEEILPLDEFMKARGSLTKQGQLEFDYFVFVGDGSKTVDIRTLVFERFKRYLGNEMYMQIENFANEIGILTKQIEGNRDWAFTAYNCLNQVVYQHKNIMSLQETNNLKIPNELGELSELWSLIRKYLFEYYNSQNSNSKIIIEALYKVAKMEKKFALELYCNL